MSQLVKTKRQANFKDFKGFGAFRVLVEQKKRCIQLIRVKIGLFFGTRGGLNSRFTRVLNWPLMPKKAQFTHELVK
jgi:hypothetical protein